MPRGGRNLKSLAFETIKRDLNVRTCAGGERVPNGTFEEYTAALTQMLGFKKLGKNTLIYVRKKLAFAFSYWKGPKQQLHLNAVQEILNKKDEDTKNRMERWHEKRLANKIIKASKPAPVPEAPVPTSSKWADLISTLQEKP